MKKKLKNKLVDITSLSKSLRLINKKTGKPSVVKSIGLPRKLLKLFYTKSEKKIGNDYRWTRNETIDINKLLKHVGITERGNPNLYKKGTNISQNHHALHNVVGRMMTNQATREYFLENNMPLHNMGTLQDVMSSNLFSKRASKASYGNRAILEAALPRIDKKKAKGEHSASAEHRSNRTDGKCNPAMPRLCPVGYKEGV